MPRPNQGVTPWIGIARVGTFQDSSGREHTFTEADLEAIRAGYDPAQSEAPLVFGHPKDSDPAFGWVSALKLEGQKLLAQFAGVPAGVKKLVQDGHYRYMSMSLSPDKRRLLHVGLLGAAAPAIDGLEAVEMSADAITISFAASGEEAPGGNMATAEELQKQVGELSEQLRALKKENDDLKGKLEASEKDKKDAGEKASKAAAEFAAFKAETEGAKRAARVRALVDAGKLEPAKEQETLSFAAALAGVTEPVTFAAPDGKAERRAAYEYTSGSGSFNRPLRGYENDWYNFKGIGKVDLNHEGQAHGIKHLTDMINRSSYDKDIWLQRGVSQAGTAAFLRIDEHDLRHLPQAKLEAKLLGETGTDTAFASCGSAKGTGFSGVIYNIYCPKDQKMKKLGAPLELTDAQNVVAETRRSLGISQAELGRLLGLTQGAVWQFETGRAKISSPVERLCKILKKHGPDILLTLDS